MIIYIKQMYIYIYLYMYIYIYIHIHTMHEQIRLSLHFDLSDSEDSSQALVEIGKGVTHHLKLKHPKCHIEYVPTFRQTDFFFGKCTYTAQNWGWDWTDQQGRGRTANRGQKQFTRSESARRRAAKGKGKGGKGKGYKGSHLDGTSPFAQQPPSTPWPTSEQLTFPSPFQAQAPVAPAQSSASDADSELIMAVKAQYPDLSKAPQQIQIAVAKAEKVNPKALSSGLQKTGQAVGQATKELHKLKEAKNLHRERWLKHLKDAVQSWEQQLKLYSEQQQNYSLLIKKATQDLNAARQTLNELNQRAGTEDQTLDSCENEEQNLNDAEVATLAQQVQTVLQACAKAATKEEAMELSDDDAPLPAAKRPRSLEPFGGPSPPAPAS